jgi:hypothetical protein
VPVVFQVVETVCQEEMAYRAEYLVEVVLVLGRVE